MKKIFHALLVITFICFNSSLYGMKRHISKVTNNTTQSNQIQELWLPDEVIIPIAAFSEPKEKNALMKVCQQFNAALKNGRNQIIYANPWTVHYKDRENVLFNAAYTNGAYPDGARSDAYDLLERLLHTKSIKVYYMYNILDKTPLHYAIDKKNKDMEILFRKFLNYEMISEIKDFDEFSNEKSQNINWIKERYNHYINTPKPQINPLHEATNEGDSKQVKFLIESGTNPNITFTNIDQDQISSLHIAADKNDIDMATLLLAYGAHIDGLDVDQENRNEKQGTPLHIAVANNNIKMAEILLNAHAQVNLQNNLGNTPLHFAVDNNNIEMANLLITHKADINICNEDGNNTPLDIAIEQGNTYMVKSLLCADGIDMERHQPLSTIVKKGMSETMKCLLCVDKIKVDWSTDFYQTEPTALYQTLAKDKAFYESIAHLSNNEKNEKIIELLKALLEAGASVNKESIFCFSSLHIAVEDDHCPEVIQLLLDNGAAINQKGTLSDRTALHYAAENGAIKTVQLLLAYGADLAIKNKFGETALSLAQDNNHADIVSLLTNHAARVTEDWIDSCFDC